MLRTLVVSVSCCLLFACGPGLTITSPEDNAVVIPTDGKVEISVKVPDRYTLVAAGECGDRENCGHLNVELMTSEGNASSFTSMACSTASHLAETTFTVDLNTCDRQVGDFAVFVALESDDHEPLEEDGLTNLVRFKVVE